MAKQKVTFTVTSGAGIDGFWIAVDDRDVVNGQALLLDAPGHYRLTWWMQGSEGASITITATLTGAAKLFSRTSKIPEGYPKGAGQKSFDLKANADA